MELIRLLKSINGTYRAQGPGKLIDRGVKLLRWASAYYLFGERVTSIDTEDARVDFKAESFSEYLELRYFSDFERELLDDFVAELRPDDIVFDVGANVGVYSVIAANIVTDGSVVAFEPYPPNVESLKQNVGMNGSEDTVNIREVALSDEEGTTTLVDKGEKNVTNGQVSGTISMSKNTDGVFARTVPGDSLCGSEVPIPSVIKIDVEGAEPLVVQGMAETLRCSDCRVVYCEVHKTTVGNSINEFGSSADEFRQQLIDLGFHVTTLCDRGEQGLLIKATSASCSPNN